ncbi:MAG: hypothetical protein CL669_04475 [Balneola sp.]|nr:hypothetical protein [Balneola sp.]
MKVRAIHVVVGLIVIIGVCAFLGTCFKEGLTDEKMISDQPTYSIIRNQLDRQQRAQDEQEMANSAPAPSDESLEPHPNATGDVDRAYTELHTGPKGEQIMATPQNTVLGVPRSKIPAGHEDLYILKSEVVPPVCPACPSGSVCPRDKPCPPCPPCARCPEPAFECAKVPSYREGTGANLPRPILNDFSQFGM